jgi:hypothetical protein
VEINSAYRVRCPQSAGEVVSVEITISEKKPAIAKTLKIHCNVADMFTAEIVDADGKVLGGQNDGYVPDFMPGQHYGDYVILDIDLDSGMVTNWRAPKPEQIQEFLGFLD